MAGPFVDRAHLGALAGTMFRTFLTLYFGVHAGVPFWLAWSLEMEVDIRFAVVFLELTAVLMLGQVEDERLVFVGKTKSETGRFADAGVIR